MRVMPKLFTSARIVFTVAAFKHHSWVPQTEKNESVDELYSSTALAHYLT